ncbi:MAG TPA: tetratricopeptide repeat protein, partial [Vicinamibacteria bacterium]
AHYRLNRDERAEDLLRKAVERSGDNAVVLDHLGDVLRRRGNVKEAVEYWRRALKGEDEDGDLDRDAVEKKIRAVSAPDAPKR